MGSRRGGDFSKFAASAGPSRATTAKIREIQTALKENKAARIVVATGIDLLAASSPPIATLVATYRVSKAAYDIANEANKAYQKTGDPNAAAVAAGKQVVKMAIGEARGEVISNMVDVGWATMKTSAHLNTNDAQDRILTAALRNTLDEVLPQ